ASSRISAKTTDRRRAFLPKTSGTRPESIPPFPGGGPVCDRWRFWRRCRSCRGSAARTSKDGVNGPSRELGAMGTVEVDRAIIFPSPRGDRPYRKPRPSPEWGFFCLGPCSPSNLHRAASLHRGAVERYRGERRPD